jgi:hypothetical protein
MSRTILLGSRTLVQPELLAVIGEDETWLSVIWMEGDSHGASIRAAQRPSFDIELYQFRSRFVLDNSGNTRIC